MDYGQLHFPAKSPAYAKASPGRKISGKLASGMTAIEDTL